MVSSPWGFLEEDYSLAAEAACAPGIFLQVCRQWQPRAHSVMLHCTLLPIPLKVILGNKKITLNVKFKKKKRTNKPNQKPHVCDNTLL